MDFSYAHNGAAERVSRTASVNGSNIPPLAARIREEALKREIPVSSVETLNFLRIAAMSAKPLSILEIGTAVGVSGICLLDACKGARLTTIDINGGFLEEARQNFKSAGVDGRVTAICGDAAEAIKGLKGKYGFIFLDGPKVQYVKYLPELVRLLEEGGTLIADDVLLYGWVNGENPVPPKRRMLAEHVREYIEAAKSHPLLETTVLDVGDGVAVSVKKYEG